MRIVFMGTPEFAVASLDALVKAGFNIVGVITAPDKPAGRGRKITQSAVKIYAENNGLKVLQPEKLKQPEFLADLKALKADLQVVVAFRMLPEVVWNMPPNGTINLHASLLPHYRGAAPINWAIINGEHQSGVSTFFLKQEIDTGDILFTDAVQIQEDDTAGDLHDLLMEKGAKLLVLTVKAIKENNYKELPQEALAEGITLKHAPKIFKETCEIDWQQPVEKVFNLIRGLSPYPTAFTTVNGKILKVFKSQKQIGETGLLPGNFLTDQQTYLKFACTDGFISFIDVQLEGKKRMSIEDFLRGIRL